MVFLLLLILAVFIRGFKPEAYGTEKFMDYGFMTSMMRADYMPPEDFWFGGKSLNYYYVGQFVATFLTKLSLVPVSHGYNLMLMTLGVTSFLLTVSLVYNISHDYFKNRNTKVKYGPSLAGILSGAGVSMAGNMHFSIFYYIIPNFQDMLGIERKNYWFSSSTRYIGYNPETSDKTIHEFPSYSFILGDLHAHVLNIIFVICLIAILYAFILDSKKVDFTAYRNNRFSALLKEAIQVKVLFIGFFIALFHMINFWDFPIYLVVAGGTILLSLIRNYGLSKMTFILTVIKSFIIIFIGELLALPFTISFDQISTNILPTSSSTPFYQMLILWGLPFLLIIGFLTELIQTYIIKKSRKVVSSENIELGEKPKNIITSNIVGFIRSLQVADLYIMILGLCAIGLVFIPELVYVEDIYSGDFKRANTMFKLTYQAFIMFGICSGYIFVKFLRAQKFLWQKKFTIISLVLFISTLGYFPVAINDWYGNIRKIDNYQGLDGSAFLKDSMEDDYHAINWINQNITNKAVILEADGESYSDYQRVSVFTGHSTVLGWYVHEWLWRGNIGIVDERVEDIKTIYTSNKREEVEKLINKYDIDYIYVGKLEQEKYEQVDFAFLISLGELVYEDNKTELNSFHTYIIKVN